ncbi:MAG: phosphoglucosamine mutase [Flavobacteriaceae bacterium]
MTLIKSISGIRGTIGGNPGENLTPVDSVKFAAAYASLVKANKVNKRAKDVIGRDARLSGPMVQSIFQNTLLGSGIDVIDLGLSTTPTVEFATVNEGADGGVIITASHNPGEWNALKLLDKNGEFLNATVGEQLLKLSESTDVSFVSIEELGNITVINNYIDRHIEKILSLPLIDAERNKSQGFPVVIDAVNSTGGIAIPKLLDRLGVSYKAMYCEPTGNFPHNPEPLEKHLGDLMRSVQEEKAHFGITVDPDVDRLALVDENGKMFGEEYTLVACADYVLSKTPGNTVSNLSSTRALKEVTQRYHQEYEASAVGEVNVVQKMKSTHAIIGGEGNGGIIYPENHYGRDALVGIALFLMLLTERQQTVSSLRASYPVYFMAKEKIELSISINPDQILKKLGEKYADEQCTTIDGLKIDFEESWVHMRKSNTEPIIRIYTEARTEALAQDLAQQFIEEIKATS